MNVRKKVFLMKQRERLKINSVFFLGGMETTA